MTNKPLEEIKLPDVIKLGSPYSYTLAVTMSPEGKPNIMGISWWTLTSIQPLLLMISVGLNRYSWECLKHLGEFTLCFPAEDQLEGAMLCGAKSGRDIDKFEVTGFEQIVSKHIKPPIIGGSTLALECRVTDVIDTGDHSVFVAEILANYATPGKENHIYTIGYGTPVALGSDKYANWDLG